MQTDQSCESTLLADQQGPRYYCRGCGELLPLGVRSHFHRECLRTDKRQRVREQRRREAGRFKVWLHNEICPKCGARYVDHRCDGAMESSCEASQPAVARPER
jgi:ribosomal protein S27AE